MWSDKYRPKNILDLVGNEEARKSFVEWFANWKKGIKPILLVGPPGIGKTTLANLAAKQFGYDLISINASDVRNKQSIQETLSPVLGNQTVLGTPMIFIDEVDGVHGRADYGGIQAITNILKESTVPIVLAANSDSSDKMKSIKKVVKTMALKPLSPKLLRLYLNRILQLEGVKISSDSLTKLVTESRGDIRSMINSVQAIVTGFNPMTEKSFESLDIEEGINAFYKAKSIEEARSILYSLRIDPREKINAFYSSIITSKVSSDDMQKFLRVISEADMLYGKIMKTQQWRLLRYLDAILLRLYKKDISVRYSKYNLSWLLLNRLRWDGTKIKSIIGSLAKTMHVSKSTFSTLYFPFLLYCIKNKKIDMKFDESLEEIVQKEIALIK
uniref:ATPase central domain-containing protein (RfcL) n=1 Tax=uncultured marine thaumarchaeote KM3_88_C09 TaxID=1456333 RepID=A0A075I1W2_9ARCH|nr:ATPase central domain-containing protein (rfcL) [uncultured marine thaumarchaeote KM3_88_C09]